MEQGREIFYDRRVAELRNLVKKFSNEATGKIWAFLCVRFFEDALNW